MPRVRRVDLAGYVYHVLNRANARAQIFDTDADYRMFEKLLADAVELFKVDLLAYCLMPNHWHLVVMPREDGELAKFMGWLSNAHTRRWHVVKGTIGQGHLYQGRYKSFLCQDDVHMLTLIRYVERNALKAGLVHCAEDWRWSSVWCREQGTQKQKKLLASWPIPTPPHYVQQLNMPQTATEEAALERSESRGVPFGGDTWVLDMVERHNLGQTLRSVGRPRNSG